MKLKRLIQAVGLVIAANTLSVNVAQASTQPYLGEVMSFGGNFCPRGWLPTNGQLLAISQNTALFSLIGTYYGGDGRTTFGLPDLRGRVQIGDGQGAGLADKIVGQKYGAEQVTLTENKLPAHNHKLNVSLGSTSDMPAGNVLGAQEITAPDITNSNYDLDGKTYKTRYYRSYQYDNPVTSNGQLAHHSISNAGSNESISVVNPSLSASLCIAVQGVFPSRN